MTDRLTIASYNIRKAIGRDGRRDPARVLGVIAGLEADVVVLQEADFRFKGRQAIFDVAAIGGATGLRAVDVAPQAPGLGWHGNMLLLRDGIDAVHMNPLELPGLEPRGAVIADLSVDGRPLRLILAHLGLIPAQRRRQARLLAGHVLPDGPTVLAGDLNAWRAAPPSLDPIARVLTLVPTGPSFPTRRPTIRFDRIYHSAHCTLTRAGAVDTPAARLASDHLPIRAELRFR